MLFGFFGGGFFRCKVNTDSYLHPHGESEGGDEMTGIHPKHIFMFYLKWKLYVMEGVQRKWQAHGCDSEWHKWTNKLNLCCEDKWTDDRKRPRRWSEVRAARNTETGWRNVTHAVNELPACLPEWRPGRKKKLWLAAIWSGWKTPSAAGSRMNSEFGLVFGFLMQIIY